MGNSANGRRRAVLFFLIVVLVLLGMNGYVLARLCHLWTIRWGRWFFGVLPAMALSFPAAILLESQVGNRLTGAFHTLAMGWLGLCWLLLVLLAAQQILERLLPLPRRGWAIGVCGIAAGLAIYATVNAHTIVVRHERIPGLPLRIAHLSDLHLGSIGPTTLANIVAMTNRLEPDLILITGDLFDNVNAATQAMTGQLGMLRAPVVFSSGNHEVYAGLERVRQLLVATSIRWLRNETMEFRGVRILGVENSSDTQLLQGVLARTPASPAFTILMNHQPIGLEVAARHGVRLMLSGHVHNGQIWPFNFLVGLLYGHLGGLHAQGGAYLIVSTGTGIWGPPMRLGSHSEIVLIQAEP
jgi:uncharacterized protein